MPAIEIELPHTDAEKDKAADLAVAAIEKQHGKGSIFNLGKKVGMPWPCIPTGIPGFDWDVSGVGGFPRGRIVEVYGPESGGKTSLCLRVIAEAQKLGDRAAIIDAENALDPTWAHKQGVNVKELLVSQPDNGEQGLEIVETLIDSGAFGIIVVDSVAALVPKAELEGEMGEAHMGLQARLMSQACRKLTGKVAKTKTCLVFINQIREKIGVMWGSPETTTGGRALKFYASLRVDVRKMSAIKEGDNVIGHQARLKAVKNKLAAPFNETSVDLLSGIGFNSIGNTLDLAVEMKLIEKNGTWLSYKGERLGQGTRQACDLLSNNAELYGKILQEVTGKLRVTES